MLIVHQNVCPNCGSLDFIKHETTTSDFKCNSCGHEFYKMTQLSGNRDIERSNKGHRFYTTPEEQARQEEEFRNSPQGKEWIEFVKTWKKTPPAQLIEAEKIEVKPLSPPEARVFYLNYRYGDKK